MKSTTLFTIAVLLVAAGGLALRVAGLARRPLHTDEAVHAVKFAQLLEGDGYEYDPWEYHGPTLNYSTLPVALAGGARDDAGVSETMMRLVPAIYGVGMVLLLWPLGRGLGRGAAVAAGVLTAISPAMIFYSRYYIQETLLVFFTLAAILCGWRWLRSGKARWCLGAGACLGLMHATKETCVIAWFSMAFAAAGAWAWGRWVGGRRPARGGDRGGRRTLLVAGAALLLAAAVSATLMSSFFTHPRGIVDSVLTYETYLHRSGGSTEHLHPWWWYLRILLWRQVFDDGPIFTELLIVALAVVGAAAILLRRRPGAPGDNALLRFLVFYTLAMTAIYSLVSYKTPWCLLGFLHGMILLAGVGAAEILRLLRRNWLRVAAAALLAAAAGQLAWQGWRANFVLYADTANPYVYAHTDEDLFRLLDHLERYEAAAPRGRAVRIDVICPGCDYWPLPWRLRRFENVAYLDAVPHYAKSAARPLPPILIAAESVRGDVARELDARPPGQKDLYLFFRVRLRPGVHLGLFVRHDLHEAAEAAGQTEP